MTSSSDGDHADTGYLPLRDLAIYAGLSVRTIRDYLKRPSSPLPSYRIGGKILVRRSEFDSWIRQFRVRTDPEAISALIHDVLAGMR